MSLKRFECEPSCGFVVQDTDARELESFAVFHMKHSHKGNITPKDVRSMTRTVLEY